MKLSREVLQYESEIIRIRRTIHQNPELSFNEKETARLVVDKLKSLGIKTSTGKAGTGVVGLLTGSNPGKVVGLRADMDALPMEEESNVEFKSRNRGIMHSCGHDTHVAMLLGAAMLLANRRSEINGTIKFIFQPAEELLGPKGSGAKLMVEQGVMNSPKVDIVIGLHIVGNLPSRTFGVRPGPVTSHSDPFWITITGKGGHQSAPDKTIDPLFVGIQVVNALQGIPSRIVDPRKPFILSVNAFNSGTKTNIIPDEAKLQGGVRSSDEESHQKALKYLNSITKLICAAFGAKCKIESKHGAPRVYNDEKITRQVTGVLKKIPNTRVVEPETGMISEDFSWYEQMAPGVFYTLGTRNKTKGCLYENHNSKFKVDEDVLKYGSVSLASIALELTNSKNS